MERMTELTLDEEVAILQFCKVVEEASHFLKKSNKHYPIRKKFLQYKKRLVKFLYDRNYCISCQELVQKNPNIVDKTPYVIVKMVFRITSQDVVFHTPKNLIEWEYSVSESFNVCEIFPQEKKNFTMDQIFRIIGVLKAIDHLNSYRKSRRDIAWTRLNEMLGWATSDKLRDMNKLTGLFED